ncbi:MAG: hypothetical protein WCC10_14115 [Tumebacillaceae bacterium]
MYASLANHVYHLAHFLFAVLFLMVVVPRYLFRQLKDDMPEERLAAGVMRVAFLYIVMGYVLVVTQLFEWLSVMTVLLLLAFRGYLRRSAWRERADVKTAVALVFYGLLDVGFRLKHWLKNRWLGIRFGWRQRLKSALHWQRVLPAALMLAILASSAYLRYYNAWTSAAPGMSDGYVTLAWLKYINQRILFHDGIYPAGFHIHLALFQKFSAIDQLYILNYTGPLVAVMIALSLYFTTYCFTGNRYAGIVAAALYGLGGTVIHGSDWARQASTNSQEFAMVFALPSLWFFARYLRHGRIADFWTAFAGCAVVGLVHEVVFGMVGMGMGVLIMIALILHAKHYWARIWPLIVAGVDCVIIALLPIVFGMAIGKKTHGSSEEFLLASAKFLPPDLRFWDVVALASLGLTFLAALVSRTRWRDRVAEWAVFGIGAATFLLYEFGGPLTNNEVIATRSGSLWALAMPVLIGAGLHAVWSLFRRWASVQALVQTATCAALIALLVKQTGMEPIKPYKMEWEAGAEQYLRIADTYIPKTWMIVSHKEGYALVLGNGYHMYLKDLIDKYDPILPPLTKKDANEPDPMIPHDNFIYNEKKVFEVSPDNSVYVLEKPNYEEYKKENAELQWWMDTYQAVHGQVDIFYEDDNLRIYHIVQPEGFESKQKRIWGSS